MACFSMAWVVQILIWAVVVSVIYFIVTLLLSKISLGEPFPTVLQIVKYLMWAVIAIAIIYFCADLISCAIGSGPLSIPRAR